jgi:hypothetical protein
LDGAERARLSRHAEADKAMDYMLKRWAAFTCFLDDRRICVSYPRYIAGEWNAPPEDRGGIPSFHAMLEAVAALKRRTDAVRAV